MGNKNDGAFEIDERLQRELCLRLNQLPVGRWRVNELLLAVYTWMPADSLKHWLSGLGKVNETVQVFHDEYLREEASHGDNH